MKQESTRRGNYPFGLTHPASFAIIRPHQAKSGLPGLRDPFTCWILNLGGVRTMLMDIHHNSPPTLG